TKEAKDFERSDILDWVNELHTYTNQIYEGVSIDDKLGYKYQYENFDTAKELLLIAGIRLAKILNYLFD
ncbi:MAG: S1/P1 Nuclease, partial [Cryomorphaceae bacterium]|nr:S1/P1 Nuclease [Cryomorphaceae bacterium]